MKISFWVAFLMIILVAIFAVQNSGAPPVTIKFFLWKFETSLIYTILGSVGLGVLLTLLFWIPREIRSSFRKPKLSQGTTPPSPPKSDKK
jgi:putative membrane protein